MVFIALESGLRRTLYRIVGFLPSHDMTKPIADGSIFFFFF